MAREEHRAVHVLTCQYPPCGRQFESVIYYAKYCSQRHKQADYHRRKREREQAREQERREQR